MTVICGKYTEDVSPPVGTRLALYSTICTYFQTWFVVTTILDHFYDSITVTRSVRQTVYHSARFIKHIEYDN